MNGIAPKKPNLKSAAKKFSAGLGPSAEAKRTIASRGFHPDQESSAIFNSYINGDIEVTEIVPRLKALYKVP